MTVNDESEEFQLSEMEKRAEGRRERLKNLRERKTLADEATEGAEGLIGIVGLRSYQPVNFASATVDTEVKEIIEGTDESVQKIIDESKNLKLGDELDVSVIAPRKVDWDLRRGIQDKLDKLDRQTNNAINTIVRQRMMQEGGNDLASNVNAMTEQVEDNE